MKILLTHGYFISDDPAEQGVMKPYPPLGILYLAAWLEKEGMDCEIYDTTFNSFETFTASLETVKSPVIGFYATLGTRMNILRTIRYLRNHPILIETFIILGGPDTRYNATEWLNSGADIVIPGEAEIPLTEIMKLLPSREDDDLKVINGIIFRNKTLEVVATSPADRLDPDRIPLPAYSSIDMEIYRQAWEKHHGYFSIALNSMRGCPYSCNWCSKSVFGNVYRRKDASLVVNEIAELNQKYNPGRFWFTDDVFTISREWLKKFNSELSSKGLKVRYECIGRTDTIDDEIILLLKRSGCVKIWIGAESGSQVVLDMMNRKTDIRETTKLMNRFREAGIATGTFIMAGYPGERKRDIFLTADYLKEARPDEFTIALAYPISGTSFFEIAEPLFTKPYEWSQFPEKQITFKRNYSNRFYYFAVRYLYNTGVALRSHTFLKRSPYLLKKMISKLFLILSR